MIHSRLFPETRLAHTAQEGRALAHPVHGGEGPMSCPACHGRGYKVYGYSFQRTYPCRVCQGQGKTTAQRVTRVAAAKKGRETAAANLRERLDAFGRAHTAEVAFLQDGKGWSDFYRSLWDQLQAKGELSDRQLEAVRNGMARQSERRTARAAERIASAPVVDLSAIHAMFETAKASGLKRLAYRAEGLVVSPASATSRNAGALYVKTKDGEYLGKVVGSRFMCVSAATDDHKATLATIAADPSGAARDYGKRTGVCCVCGIELTDPKSVAAGIGPICAKKWGL